MFLLLRRWQRPMSCVWLFLFRRDVRRMTMSSLGTSLNKIICQKLNLQSDDVLHSKTIRALVVLLTRQVLHFWPFWRLRIMSKKSFMDSKERSRLLPLPRCKTDHNSALCSLFENQALRSLTGHTTHPLKTERTGTTNNNKIISYFL